MDARGFQPSMKLDGDGQFADAAEGATVDDLTFDDADRTSTRFVPLSTAHPDAVRA
jgi:hypothetical protein